MTELFSGAMAAGDLPSAEEMLQQSYDEVKEQTDWMIQILEQSLQDVDMTVYVDPKGRLASLTGTTTVVEADMEAAESEPTNEEAGTGDSSDAAKGTGEGSGANTDEAVKEKREAQIDFALDLHGGSYLTENMNGRLSITSEGATTDILYEKRKAMTGAAGQRSYGVCSFLRWKYYNECIWYLHNGEWILPAGYGTSCSRNAADKDSRVWHGDRAGERKIYLCRYRLLVC